jgi:hypothetical protein
MPPTAEESSPLTFDLKEDLLAKIDAVRRRLGLASTSEVIRLAIGEFNFDSYAPETVAHRQISVRLPVATKGKLVRVARRKDVSVGELLRSAIEALQLRPSRPVAAAAPPARKATAKKPAAKGKAARRA